MLSDNEERLRLAIDAAALGTWDWNIATGRIVLSPQGRAIFGREIETREAFLSALHPEDAVMMTAVMGEIWRGGEVGPALEYRIVRPDGDVRWVEGYCKVIRDGHQGRPVRLLGAVTDITARKRSEHERSQLEAQLQQAQKMESLGRFAGGVAHDFNNLLTVIQGNVDLLRRVRDGSELRDISRAATSAAVLIRQILVFGRKAIINPRVIDLAEPLSRATSMLGRIIGEDVTLEFRAAAALWPTRVDEGQIEQVLLNLATNARDAMPQGGRFLVELQNVTIDEQNQRQHPNGRPGRYVCLSATDSGVGMDEHSKAHVFEPFFTTKEVGKGSGLGLAMVFGVVAQSGGFVEVESRPGEGATFRLYFPWASVEAHPSAHEQEPKAVGGSETVLLVEDEEHVRALVARVLEMGGYRVLAAAHPEEALALWARQAPSIDLLLTDGVMPGMSGRELARRLRAEAPRLPVLMMTGYAPSAETGGDLTEAEVVYKPFKMDALVERVRELLDRANRPT